MVRLEEIPAEEGLTARWDQAFEQWEIIRKRAEYELKVRLP